jgi:outer membrane lipoprotein-sorting protein
MQQITRAVTAAFAVAVLSLPSLAGAQALPTVTEVLDRHVAAIGGREAAMSVSSIQQRGTLEMAAMGISAEVTLSAAKPNKSSMLMSIPGLGEIQQGFNGDVAWSNDPMSGPRLAEGEELAARKASSNFEESFGIYDMEKFTSITVVEKTMFGGEDAYKLEFVRKVGPKVLTYYSVATGLYIGSQTSVVSPMGNVEVNAVASDYKTFGKLKLPTRIAQSQAGQDVVITLSDVKFDAVTDDAFAIPAAVKALIKP